MRSPIKMTLSAAGVTPWIETSYKQRPFCVTAVGIPSSGSTVSYGFDITYDNPSLMQDCAIVRAATVMTVTLAKHGLSVDDDAVIGGTGDANLDGRHAVASVVDANTFTCTVANTGLTAPMTPKCAPVRVIPDSTVTAKADREVKGYVTPFMAIRLNATAVSAGDSLDILVIQGNDHQ